MANRKALKRKAHGLIDRICAEGKARRDVYILLGQKMNIPMWRCHIGMFGKEECEESLRILGEIRDEAVF